MADERIDIEITDKVDPNVERKILGIATASDKGYTSVQKLKNALKDVNTTAVSKLAAASNSATNALAREMNASAKLTVARAREAESTARVALQTQKLATEQAKTAAATLRAQAASDRAAAAKAKESNASAALTAQLEREASAKSRIIHDRNVVQPGSGAGFGAAAGSRADASAATNMMRRTPIAPAVADDFVPKTNAADDATKRLNDTLGKAAGGAGLARHQMVNLGYQLQDIFVSLQAGQAPLTVFIQQGSQIAGIAAASGLGLGAMAKAALSLLAPFALVAAALAALYFGFKQFTADSAAKHKPELDKYANSLGLTSKEMRKLGNETVGANGKLKSFDTVTITMGDSWKGFTDTVKEGLASLVAPFEGVGGAFKGIWSEVTNFLYMAFVGFYGAVVGGMRAIVVILKNLPSVAGQTALAIVNAVITAVEWAVNKSIDGINWLTSGANVLLDKVGLHVGTIGQVSFGRFARSGKDAFQIIGEEAVGAMKEADATMTAFGKRWDANNLKNAKSRIKAQADAIKANRNPKAGPKPKEDHTAENRAHALDVLNSKLDDELSRMKLLKPEREIQARMDQIENDLLQKKIKLNDTEKASVLAKVKAIEAYKFVQAETDRIYEAAVEPLRTYNATLTAASDLLKQNAINQAQYNQEVANAARVYKEATDPLFSLNEELGRNVTAAGLYGRAVEQNSFAESVYQAFLAKKIDLLTNATEAQKAEAAAIIAKNNALLQQQFIQSQVGAIVNPILENQSIIDSKTQMYAEIDRLEANSVLTHQQHEQAKLALDAKFSELRLSNASATFGALAQLSSSGNSKLAAIGKAAAVAQATIDGYVAVQKALASGPPPWNFIQAAAVGVMTGVQVAGILSTNVGSFATGGQFMVDGRAGVDNNNINMNVSRGERITVETAAQQRANDGASGGGKSPLNVKVVNVTDPKDIEAALSDPDNDHLVLNVLRRNPGAVKQLQNS